MNKILTLITLVVFVSCKNAGRNAHLLVNNDLSKSTKSELQKEQNKTSSTEGSDKNDSTEDQNSEDQTYSHQGEEVVITGEKITKDQDNEDQTYSHQGEEVVITGKRITKDDSPLNDAECGDLEYSGVLEVIEDISKNKENANKPKPGDADHDCSTATEEERQLCNDLTVSRIAKNIKEKNEQDNFDGAPRIKHPLDITQESQRASRKKEEVAKIETLPLGQVKSNKKPSPIKVPQASKVSDDKKEPKQEQALSQEEQRENFIDALGKFHAEVRKSEEGDIDPACVEEAVEEITEELNKDCEVDDQDCEYTEDDVNGTLSAEDIIKILEGNKLDDDSDEDINLSKPGSSDQILQGNGPARTGSGTSAVSNTFSEESVNTVGVDKKSTLPTFNTKKIIPEISNGEAKIQVRSFLASSYLRYLKFIYGIKK